MGVWLSPSLWRSGALFHVAVSFFASYNKHQRILGSVRNLLGNLPPDLHIVRYIFLNWKSENLSLKYV